MMFWFLLIIGVLLVVLNVKAIRKERNSFNNIFHNEVEDMKEFELRLGEMRREFSETILELQKEIQELKAVSRNNLEDKEENNENKYSIIVDNTKVRIGSNEIISKEYSKPKRQVNLSKKSKVEKNDADDNSVKIDEINKMLSEGYSVEEVSNNLGIGKGEVLLIKDLYLK